MIGNVADPNKGVRDMQDQCTAIRSKPSPVVTKASLMDRIRVVATLRRRFPLLRPGDLSDHLLRDIGLDDTAGNPRRHA
jgi:hypothetical protein